MQHLAIIPDGNRRWASQHKLASFFGHKKGLEPVRYAIKVAIKNGIKYLSLYTFSIENFRRSENEKSYLFDLLMTELPKELPDLINNGVRIRFIGDRSRFPSHIIDAIKRIEDQTSHLDTLNVNLLFCYGATTEIAYAVKVLAQKVKDGLLNVDDIDEQTVHDSLWTAGMPDPDLIIRTGNLARLSNFLLFQAAYSEFSFLDCFWPEVTEERLEQCIQSFNNTKRNFGK
jgi:undecaprenyl diphosphate synthase